MRLGFVGTGTITEAVVTGLISAETNISSIVISPRNHDIATRLATIDPHISVGTSNQDVLDRVDVVCLAVRPQIARSVLSELKFRASHHVISFIATLSGDAIAKMVAPAHKVVRTAPLPAVAHHMGTTAICPPDTISRQLFASLGTAVEVDDRLAFDALFAATASMGSYFALLEGQAAWLVDHGVSYEIGREFLSRFYLGLANAATHNAVPFSTLTREFMTKGGINEQVFKQLSDAGMYKGYADALDGVLARIQRASSELTDEN
jgi:pyrroline-5-carboxylate reductase